MRLATLASVLVIIAIMFTVVSSVMGAVSTDVDPDREYDVTGPEYRLLDVFLFSAPVVLWLLYMRMANHFSHSSSAGGTRLDTPGKAIDRYKRQYVEGELSLDEFEDRVYQTIPVEVEEP